MKRWFSFQSDKKPGPIVPPPSGPAANYSPISTKKLATLAKERPRSTGPVEPLPSKIWHELTILATESGLLVRPVSPNAAVHMRISWGKNGTVAQVKATKEGEHDWSTGVTVYGMVGILSLFSTSYLLVVSATTDLGILLDPSRPVYGVKAVTSIPLEYARANTAIGALKLRNTKPATANAELEPDMGKNASLHVKWAPQQPPSLSPPNGDNLSVSPASSGTSTPTSAAIPISPFAKVLVERLSFWKTKRVSRTTDGASEVAIDDLMDSMDQGAVEPSEVLDTIITAAAPPPQTVEERHSELEEKVIKETIRQFTRGGMYFSYGFDLSNSLQRKQQQVTRLKRQRALLQDLEALGDWHSLADCESADPFCEPFHNAPLWKRVDRKFWWNEHLLKPFIEASLDEYILPILQGYFQTSSFHVPGLPDPATPPATTLKGAGSTTTTPRPSTDTQELVLGQSAQNLIKVDYVIISRRSRDRAGLRYQRRGVDDDANVANFTETETVMRVVRERTENIFSYVQIRGSIPLYWTQPGYGLKPAPTLDPARTSEQNLSVLKAHFEKLVQRYGPNTVINLVEQHGKEGALSEVYREKMHELHSKDAQYHEFDFHAECKGMRYENISKLVGQVGRTFEKQGFFWVSDSVVMSQQKGVFRVNCIDCLDRTNVVQSAFGREVLSSQLEALAVLNPSDGGQSEAEVVFNDVWANNGDAISRAYAGTSALKGDFTRTGKRDLTGLLHDGINSLSRVYSATFSDWFSQAVIDYMLGHRGTSVFAEFLRNLSSSDPRDMLRLSKIRAAAIESSTKIVVLDGEDFKSGWTMLSPVDFNVRISDKFEEKILLVTSKAIYIISYDYGLDKVKMFTRVRLGDVVGIQKGAYILSTLNQGTRDPANNYGFVITYRSTHQDTRVTSYSVRNQPVVGQSELGTPATSPTEASTSRKRGKLSEILTNVSGGGEGELVSVALKSLPVDPARWQTRGGSGPGVEGGPGAGAGAGIGAETCKEAVEAMVVGVKAACEEAGVVDDDGDEGFITEEDIVSVAEAQRSTTLFAKFEYSLKRLLWLGG